MSNRSTLFELVATLSEEGAGAALVKLGAATAPPSLSDTPDGSNGSVALGLVTNPSWTKTRIVVKRIADALPPGTLARATAEIALSQAQAGYNIFRALRSYPVYECEQYLDQQTGLPGFRNKLTGPNNDQLIPIAGVCVFPPVVEHGFDLSGEQGLTDFLNWVPPSSTGNNPDFSPHH